MENIERVTPFCLFSALHPNVDVRSGRIDWEVEMGTLNLYSFFLPTLVNQYINCAGIQLEEPCFPHE